MLTKGDEYPIHQLPEPIAYAGSDPNFYDRYFFNGYSMENEAFFGMALGVYPHVNIIDASESQVKFKSGTRHAASALIRFWDKEEEETQIHIEPLYQFFMSGLGYAHPEWGHGMNKGELATAYDTIDLKSVDETALLYLHIQAVSKFRMGDKTGMGVLEQAIIGAHAPSGFKEFLDVAP